MHFDVVMRCLLVSKANSMLACDQAGDGFARDQTQRTCVHFNVVMRCLLVGKANSMLACDQAGDVCS